jgi:hypothetical protein
VAGVGNATIYRRWSSKHELIREVLCRVSQARSTIRGETIRDRLIGALDEYASSPLPIDIRLRPGKRCVFGCETSSSPASPP